MGGYFTRGFTGCGDCVQNDAPLHWGEEECTDDEEVNYSRIIFFQFTTFQSRWGTGLHGGGGAEGRGDKSSFAKNANGAIWMRSVRTSLYSLWSHDANCVCSLISTLTQKGNWGSKRSGRAARKARPRLPRIPHREQTHVIPLADFTGCAAMVTDSFSPVSPPPPPSPAQLSPLAVAVICTHAAWQVGLLL